MQPPQRKATWIAICIAGCTGFLGVANYEGQRTVAYKDVNGTPTACYGETAGITLGETFTADQCRAMLAARIERDYGPGVDRCTKATLPPKRKAAMVDFAYNEGIGRYCRVIAPLLNAGKTVQACDKLLEFTKAGGIEYKGLVRRRKEERQLCLEELT